MGTVDKILGKTLSDDFKGFLTQKFPEWRSYVRKGEIGARTWLRGLSSELVRLVFLAVIVCVIYIAGLYFLRASWHIFENTMIGIRYIENVNGARAATISWVLSLDFRYLGAIITLLSVLVSVVVGGFCQLTMLRRFFYVGRSSLIKLGWGGGVSAVVASQFVGYYPMEFYLAFGLCFLPTMIIFSSVLSSAGKLLPELNLLLFIDNYRKRKDIQALKDDIAQLMNEDSGEDF